MDYLMTSGLMHDERRLKELQGFSERFDPSLCPETLFVLTYTIRRHNSHFHMAVNRYEGEINDMAITLATPLSRFHHVGACL